MCQLFKNAIILNHTLYDYYPDLFHFVDDMKSIIELALIVFSGLKVNYQLLL